MRIVGISGSLRIPSRTVGLVAALLDEIEERLGATDGDGRADRLEIDFVDLAVAAPKLFAASTREDLADAAAAIVATVESADALVVGTPVYRGSYTGALKHLFDLVDRDALAGKPVLLAATAGLPEHGLVIEHQLRPLFGFFRALTVPTTVFLTEGDFHDYRVVDARATARIARAADEFADLVETRRSPSGRAVPDGRFHAASGERAEL